VLSSAPACGAASGRGGKCPGGIPLGDTVTAVALFGASPRVARSLPRG
jgi:hypothetical protein